MSQDKETLFLDLAILCRDLEGSPKRTEKVQRVASFLNLLKDEELAPVVRFITGRVFPENDDRALDVSGASLWRISHSKRQASLTPRPLTILSLTQTFDQMALTTGKGSRLRKLNVLESLLSCVSELEAGFLARLLLGEMRIGVVEGVMIEAIAKASKVDPELVRRSHMLLGDLGETARIALRGGSESLGAIRIQLFSPVKLMLAEMSYDIGEVLREHGGRTAFEFKYDGARIQIHKNKDKVEVYSRRLTRITESLPDIVNLARVELQAEMTLVEGEVVAVDAKKRPLPFQDLMRRLRRRREVSRMTSRIPLQLYLFDILHLEGRNLLDTGYDDRWSILTKVASSNLLARRVVTAAIEEANTFLEASLREGHEGLMAKALDSKYILGMRGKRWFKIKPAMTLDLAVTAADWGYGRRTGWLSNYHLAVRDEFSGNYLPVGKTFKGLTDEEFQAITGRLQALKISENRFTVFVKPQIVVEVAFNEIQKSPHYESGFALRFARITKIRDDKPVDEVDSLQTLRKAYENQFVHKGKLDLP